MLSRRAVGNGDGTHQLDCNRGLEFLDKLKGIDTTVELGGNNDAPARPPEAAKQVVVEEKKSRGSGVLWKNHPTYSRFFRQVEVGAPLEAVKAKMRMAGFDAGVLEYSLYVVSIVVMIRIRWFPRPICSLSCTIHSCLFSISLRA